MRREEIIQSAIDSVKAKTYLEIGVHRGKNFFAISAPLQIAVDPAFKIGYTRRLKHLIKYLKSQFYETTSNNFFAKHAPSLLKNRKLDVAFIDGLHTYEQALEDFEYCLKYLSSNGVILFHDCNPLSPEAAEPASSPEDMMKKFPGKNSVWNGDVWKTIIHIRSTYPELNVFVLDCDHGIGVVHRSAKNATDLSYTKQQIEAMGYADLDRDRSRLLNLKSPEYWDEFIKTL